MVQQTSSKRLEDPESRTASTTASGSVSNSVANSMADSHLSSGTISVAISQTAISPEFVGILDDKATYQRNVDSDPAEKELKWLFDSSGNQEDLVMYQDAGYMLRGELQINFVSHHA